MQERWALLHVHIVCWSDHFAQTTALLAVLSSSNKSWNYRVEPFQLPPLTRMVLADVDAGSDTPSLVGKVLKWRKEDNERGTAQANQFDMKSLLIEM
jgi:phosphomevalonate kinase